MTNITINTLPPNDVTITPPDVVNITTTIDGVTTVTTSSLSPNNVTVTQSNAVAVVTGLAQGLQGIQGEQGIQGVQGVQGEQGEQGEQGVQGLQGAPGVQGEQGLQGIQGIQGIQGLPGADGVGVPSGGSTGQILAKASNDDYDSEWVDQSGGGGGEWGDITGTLSDQTDLQAALDLKIESLNFDGGNATTILITDFNVNGGNA
jgi:hypothetical protein